MATITIRNLPEALHQRLKKRAEDTRRSLNNEIIVLLERALEEGRTGEAEDLRERVRAVRNALPALDMGPEELKQAMREGLPETKSDFDQVLSRTDGIWTAGDGLEYQTRLREEWERTQAPELPKNVGDNG